MRSLLHRLFVATLVGATAGIVFSATAAIASHQFPDVPTSHPLHDNIDWAVDNKVATGYSDGKFRPGEHVTRGQLSGWFRRSAGLPKIIHDPGSMTAATEGNNTVTCPSGTRPIAGGGSTSAFNLMLTDLTISSTSVSTRWETDNNAAATATLDTWATCMPKP
jgi:hypothetical protein